MIDSEGCDDWHLGEEVLQGAATIERVRHETWQAEVESFIDECRRIRLLAMK